MGKEREIKAKAVSRISSARIFYFLAGKSASQMNYSLTKQMFAACRDGDEQLDIVKESLLLSEKSFLLMISHV